MAVVSEALRDTSIPFLVFLIEPKPLILKKILFSTCKKSDYGVLIGVVLVLKDGASNTQSEQLSTSRKFGRDDQAY